MKWISCLTSFGFVLFLVYTFPAADAVPECVPPFVPMNGSIDMVKAKYEAGDKIKYSCSSQFVLVGNEIRTCQTDSTWTDQMPFCDRHALELDRPSCSIPTKSKDELNLIDQDLNSCFLMDVTSQRVFVPLKTPAVVNAVRIFLPQGSYQFGVSVLLRGDEGSGKTLHKTLAKDGWVSFVFQDTATALSVCIQDKTPGKTAWKICEIEVYGNEESLCKNPPNQAYVPNGRLIISRERAVMECDVPKNRTGLYFLCEKGQWKGVGKMACADTRQKSDSTKIVIIASVAVAGLILICFLVVLIVICKKKTNSVVVVMKPKEHYCRSGGNASPAEAEYATVIYEDIPLTPRVLRKLPKTLPPNLPDLLKKYSEPADKEKASIHEQQNTSLMQSPGYVMPQDALLGSKVQPGSLKTSSFYGE